MQGASRRTTGSVKQRCVETHSYGVFDETITADGSIAFHRFATDAGS